MQQAEAVLVRRLQSLNCPLAEAHAWSTERAFGPGQGRLELIEWLVQEIDPLLAGTPIRGLAQDQDAHAQREQKLLILLATLGLCEETDVHLIQGTAQIERQILLMNSLTELAVIARRPVATDRLLQPMRKMNELAASDALWSMLSTNGNILDANMAAMLAGDSKKPVPSLVQLQQVVNSVQGATEEMQSQLQDLLTHLGRERTEQALPLLADAQQQAQFADTAVALRDALHQFKQVAQRDIRPWLRKASPAPSELGAAAMAVCDQQKRLNQFYGNLSTTHKLLAKSITAATESSPAPTDSVDKLRELLQMARVVQEYLAQVAAAY